MRQRRCLMRLEDRLGCIGLLFTNGANVDPAEILIYPSFEGQHLIQKPQQSWPGVICLTAMRSVSQSSMGAGCPNSNP